MRIGICAALLLAVTACSVNDREESRPVPPQLASGRLLPSGCVVRRLRPAATVAFVAAGRAWALEPRGSRLTCLFTVRDPGLFAWGPRGDRALLARLEVKGVGEAPSRAPGATDPVAASWGRPIGKAIVFVGHGGRALLKAHPAGGGFSNVTPLTGVQYERVVYHPSGLAFAFVVRRTGREEVWISSNVGKEPRMLVHGRFHTGFDAIAFSRDGRKLYFSAHHADGHVDLHSLALDEAASGAPVEWRGGPHERVTDVFPGRGEAISFTVGRSCPTRRAVVVDWADPEGADALPDADSSRALGWIDDGHLLVATGACAGPFDLYSVATASLTARLLVRSVEAVAVRRPERLPPPPLPAAAGARSGFA